MRFGAVPVTDAAGVVLAHSIRLPGGSMKKGRRLSVADVAALQDAGLETVVAAQLQPGDVHEDEAAARIAAACCGPGLRASAAVTGRCNLVAGQAGMAVLDASRVDRLNLVDEAITLATVPPMTVMAPGQMVATVKIIPFAAPRDSVAVCEAIAGEGGPLLRLAPLRPRRVALIQTRLPGTKDSILDKTVDVTRARVEALGSTLDADIRCAHDVAAAAAALQQALAAGSGMVLLCGASAIVDRRDVIPAAIEAAGGEVEHFGMPVDPGNLLLLGHHGAVPVLGLPGCARSPKLNGFDWVLQRLLCDVPVGREAIMRMGVGGLLTDIPTRPLPRAKATAGRSGPPVPAPAASNAASPAPRIAALVLAAGRSTRMGTANKLLAPVEGVPMIRHVVDAALASRAAPVVVVVGHEAERLREALAGQAVTVVENPDYREGLSTSLRAGLAALAADVDGAVICLGDMPRLRPGHIDRLIAAFNPAEGRAICVPAFEGKRGNPVLWGRGYFAAMGRVSGDVGAKHLMAREDEAVCEVAMPDDAVLVDVDTPDALSALRTGIGS